ncbi:MAG: TonB-dependent receptor [Parvularculaceae bacterium]|nr:TonB-dependent receptor [Parvularculaceae bacterium]
MLASFASSMALTAATAQAQDDSDDGGLDTIYVTATKRQESTQDIGVSVSALSGDAIDRINPGDSTELAQQVPSLEIRGNFGATNANVFLRGVGSTGVSFNLQGGVGILSDEVVLNSPVVNILQVYDLERVEVLRGPQNTLYGRNTTGGAINFISRQAEVGGDANGYVQATYGRFNQKDVNAAFGAPIGDLAAFRVAVQYQTRDGIRENLLTGEDDQSRDNLAGRFQLAMEPTERIDLNLKVHAERVRGSNIRLKTVDGFDSDLTTPCSSPDTLGACFASNGFQDTSDPRQISSDMNNPTNDVDSGGASFSANIDFDAFTLTSITAYEENSQTLSSDEDGLPSPSFHFYLNNSQEQWSQEVRLTSDSSNDLRWIVGGYYFAELLKGQTGPLFGTPMGTMLVQSFAKFDNTTWSGYGEVEYDINETLTLKLGGRYGSDNIQGQSAALLAFENFLPGVDLNDSLLNGVALPDFGTLSQIAVDNGIGVFTGGAVGGGPNRLIAVGGDLDPDAQINDTTFENWGGKAGVDWKPADGVLVYAQWSRGFKSGRFNAAPMSIMNLDSETGRSFGDTPVREEVVNAYELGIKTELWDNRARLNAAIFYNDYTDQQINQFIAGEFTVVNADSTITGGEVELNLAPGGGIFVDAGASVLSTDVDNPMDLPEIGDELPLTPDLTFNIAARKEWDLSNGTLFSLSADGNYVGERFFDLANATEDEGYFIANARASLDFGPSNEYRLTIWGKNIFNEEFFSNRFDDVSGLGPDTVLLNDPATYGVTLRGEF